MDLHPLSRMLLSLNVDLVAEMDMQALYIISERRDGGKGPKHRSFRIPNRQLSQAVKAEACL